MTLALYTGGGNFTGAQTCRLANSWSYATGTYTATITNADCAPRR